MASGALRRLLRSQGVSGEQSRQSIGSGVNDNRAKFLALLEDQHLPTIVFEHRDPVTSFGFRYLDTLLRGQGRRLEVVNLAEKHREDLLAHLVSMVDSFAARLYRQRRAKRKTEAIVKQVQEADDECSWWNNISSAKVIRAMLPLIRPLLPPKTCITRQPTRFAKPTSMKAPTYPLRKSSTGSNTWNAIKPCLARFPTLF